MGHAWFYERVPAHHGLVCWRGKLKSPRVSFEIQSKSFQDGFGALSFWDGFALVEEGGWVILGIG